LLKWELKIDATNEVARIQGSSCQDADKGVQCPIARQDDFGIDKMAFALAAILLFPGWGYHLERQLPCGVV
jgi:hypothetical protein